MSETLATSSPLRTTPLDALHRSLGARMVPFAGYDMPVQYPTGILAEHNWTRSHAGLFDVSHMGQVRVTGPGAIAALETLVPGDIQALEPGRMRYTTFTAPDGGILDDLMVTQNGDHLFLVVNAGCKDDDVAHLRAHLGPGATLEYLESRALLALQGPEAAAVLGTLCPDAAEMPFMSAMACTLATSKGGIGAFVTRSGYTGEDGFELSVPGDRAEELATVLLADDRVKPIGLGARDSLRLEAGLCLYGHDIDRTTNPIEAGLAWTISKRRRAEGGFPGADVVQKALAEGPARKRVGLLPDGGAPAREGTEIQALDGTVIGRVTSGGFGPTVGRPVSMGYVAASDATAGTQVQLIVRGQPRPAAVAPMPFVPHRYHR